MSLKLNFHDFLKNGSSCKKSVHDIKYNLTELYTKAMRYTKLQRIDFENICILFLHNIIHLSLH